MTASEGWFMALTGNSVGCGKQENRASTFALARLQLRFIVSRALHRMHGEARCTQATRASRKGKLKRRAPVTVAA
jgi:hypothetical protein